ncbi:MAG: insulinase family protein [Prevotellaceae bacterium]|nr:insulinase family protein [Candidatus Minthosoma caballi]
MQPQLKTIKPIIAELPQAQKLDNGVELNIVPLDDTEMLTLNIVFKGGQWVQDKNLQSDFALSQLRSGTQHYSSEYIEEKLDFYGASLFTSTNLSFGLVRLTALRRTLADVLPILTDMLVCPVYEQEKLNIAVEEGVFAYTVSQQKVAEVCKRMFYKKVLGEENPAAKFPVESDYRSICREDLLRYHRNYLRMDNAVVYATGKIDDEIVKLLNCSIGSIECGVHSLIDYQSAPMLTEARGWHEDELQVPSVQSALRMGKVMPDTTHPDFPALLLTGTILGGYFGSRLMSNIRERLGFTYGIGSTFYHIPGVNIFITATETPQQNVKRCVEEIGKEIADLQSKPVTEDEMAFAKNYMLGQFCRKTEVSFALPAVLMSKRVHGLTLEDYLHEQERIQALTAEDVMMVAQKYFEDGSLLVSAVHGKG